MQFSSFPLSLTPLAGATQQPLAALQDFEKHAQSSAGQDGLFALILSRLGVGHPADAPVADSPGPVIANLTVRIADTDPQPAGKPLPPLLPVGDTIVPPLNEVQLAEPGAGVPGDALLPLPVLPQPLKQPGTPELPAVTTGRVSRPAQAPTAAPLATEPVVVTRDALFAAGASRPASPGPELPALRPLVADVPETVMLPQQHATPANPAVALSPSLSPAPGPAVATANTPVQHAYTLNQPVADPQWGSELGKRLIWMNGNGIGRAELRLNPPELGPVEVRIAVANDDARVAFQVQHGATREALENAMPRLREMFASQGLNLNDASVSEHGAQNPGQTGQSGDGAGDEQTNGTMEQLAGEMGDAPDEIQARPLDGLIDAYA